MRNILMIALGSGPIAMGLVILATLWRSRASLHPLPKQVSGGTDTGVPSRPNAAMLGAAFVRSEKSGNNGPTTDVMSAVNELAKEIIVEEARRAAEVEAARDSKRATYAEAEQQAQQISKNAAGRAQDAIRAVQMTTDSVTDEIGSALTNIYNLLPASNDSADGPNNKLGVGNGHVTVPASAIRKRGQTIEGSVDTEQREEGPAERLQTIEAERVPAANEGLEDAAELAGKELVTSETGEGADSQEKEAGRTKQGQVTMVDCLGRDD